MLILCAAVIVAMILCGAALVILQIRDNVRLGAEHEMANLNLILAEHSERMFQSSDETVSEVIDDLMAAGATASAATYRSAASGPELHKALHHKLAGDRDRLDALSVIDTQGDVINSSRYYPVPPLNVSDRDYFIALRDNPKVERFISAPIRNPNTGTRTIYLARPINALDGSFIGLVLGTIDLKYFEDFYHDIHVDNGSAITLWREDGVPLVRYPNAAQLTDHLAASPQTFRDVLARAQSSVVYKRGAIDPVPMMISARAVRGYPLVVALSLREDVLLARWWLQAVTVGIAGIIASLAVCGIAWLLLRQFAVHGQIARARAQIEHETRARQALRENAERLRKSERHLAQAQNAAGLGSVEFDFRTNRVEWSEETYRILGLSRDTDPADHDRFLLMVVREDRGRVQASLEAARKGQEPDPIEYRIQRPDGNIRSIYRGSELLRDEAGNVIGLISTLRDVTEQRFAEQRIGLLQSASLAVAEAEDFNSALEVVLRLVCTSAAWPYGDAWMPDPTGTKLAMGPVWHIDDPTLAKFAEASRDFTHGPGVGVIGTVWQARRPLWVHDISQSKLVHPGRIGLALKTGFKSIYALPICAGKDVLAIIAFFMSEISRQDQDFIATISAVAAQLGTALKRKQVEQALRESEERLDRAQHIAGVASWELDVETSRYVWSKEMYRIRGVPTSYEPSMGTLPNYIHPDDFPSVHEWLARLKQGLNDGPLEFRIQRPDGQMRIVSTEGAAIRAAGGTIAKVAGTMRDITEIRKAEQEKHELEARLQQTQRLEALGTLAGGIAHDLNNTMVPVIALSKMMMKKLPEGSAERANIEMIYRAGARARDLVRQVLAFSRREQSTRLVLDVDDSLQEVLQMMRATVPSTIHIEYAAGPELPQIMGDKGQLHQVLINLLTNAVHAIGDQTGKIVVTLAATAPARSSGGAKSAPMLRLTIRDTGCGMDKATLRRIFDPFFTTKAVGEGTGLGLAVVHGIVTGHGGSIDVWSEPGAGTQFDIFLPAIDAEMGAEPRQEAISAHNAIGGSELETGT